MNQPVSISRVSRLFATFLAIALVAGCGDGPSLAKVTGKITVNGKPAVGATLLFHPVDVKDAPVATGVADNDGKFTLTSHLNTGASPGNYIITVTWPDPAVKPTEAQKIRGDAEPGPDLLKGRYVMKDKSSLTAEITSSTTELPVIELKSK